MYTFHGLPKGVCHHCLSTIVATYFCPLPLPKGGSLPRRPPLVRLITHFTPDKTRCAWYGIGLAWIRVYPQPLKHIYECRNHPLNPAGIHPRNAAIVGIKHYVLLPRRPSQNILSLLWYTYINKCGPQYHINHYVEYWERQWIPLGNTPLRF